MVETVIVSYASMDLVIRHYEQVHVTGEDHLGSHTVVNMAKNMPGTWKRMTEAGAVVTAMLLATDTSRRVPMPD